MSQKRKSGPRSARPYSMRMLVDSAVEAKLKAYAPYSRFRVGAALVSNDGTLFTGCNVENSSFSLTICAERNALFKAVSEGQTGFSVIAITSDNEGFLTPCGACRQVLAEFAPGIEVILATSSGKTRVTSLKELFPMPADLKKLKRSRRTRS